MNKTRITKYASVLAIVTLIVGLVACEDLTSLISDDGAVSYETTIPQLEGLSGEIPIGLVVSKTGPFSESYGLPMLRGFELALEEINNSQIGDARIKFRIEDDKGTIDAAVEAFNELIQQVPAILGPTLSSQAREVFPIAEQNQVVAFASISAASGLSAIGNFNFRVNLPTDVLNPSGVEATQKRLGYQKVATIYDESDLYSTDSDAELRKALINNGVQILTSETFQTGDTSFSDQLTRIMKLNPDALFVSALNTAMAEIVIQGRQILPSSVDFIVPDITETEVKIAKDAAEGVVTFTGWAKNAPTPGNEAFVRNYRAKYNVDPSNWAAQSYTAVYILATAIANAKSTDSTAVRDEMARISNYETVLGEFSFDANGDAIYDPLVLIVENGQFKVFEDVDTIDTETHIIADLAVEEVSLRVAESFPPQVFLDIDGVLPDSCTTLYKTTEQRDGNTIHVHITTKRPKDLVCATVITPVHHVVALGFFEPGEYRIIVNGVGVPLEI